MKVWRLFRLTVELSKCQHPGRVPISLFIGWVRTSLPRLVFSAGRYDLVLWL